jgi:hypothetical protein
MPRSSAPILQTSSNQLVETRAIRPAKKKKARASTSPRPLMQEIKNHFGENRSANSRTCHSGSTRKAANVVSRKIRNLCIFLTCLARVVCVLSPSVLPPGLLFGGIYCAEISFPATGCHVLQLSFALPPYARLLPLVTCRSILHSFLLIMALVCYMRKSSTLLPSGSAIFIVS